LEVSKFLWLADLATKGALRRVGELRHARYFLNVPTRTVSPVSIDEHGMVE
jgi:hypothetical protein